MEVSLGVRVLHLKKRTPLNNQMNIKFRLYEVNISLYVKSYKRMSVNFKKYLTD